MKDFNTAAVAGSAFRGRRRSPEGLFF